MEFELGFKFLEWGKSIKFIEVGKIFYEWVNILLKEYEYLNNILKDYLIGEVGIICIGVVEFIVSSWLFFIFLLFKKRYFNIEISLFVVDEKYFY